MKDDFEIIDLDNTSNLSLTQVNLEVEELERELKKLQESQASVNKAQKAVSNEGTSARKTVSNGASKKKATEASGRPVSKSAKSSAGKTGKTPASKPVAKNAKSVTNGSKPAATKAATAKPAPKKKQPLVTSKVVADKDSWDDLHDISAKEAKRASDAMKPGKSIYKTNTEAYAESDRNVADMLAEYDDISNTEKPRKLKKQPVKNHKTEPARKQTKAAEKPQSKPVRKAKSAEEDSLEAKSVKRENRDVAKTSELRKQPVKTEPKKAPQTDRQTTRKEPEIQITPVATTGVKLGNKSGTSIGSVGGSYGLNQVGGTPKKSRYQLEMERASKEAQLVYESNRSANRSAATAINAKKEAEAAIAFIDDDLGITSDNKKTIDTSAKHAATAKGAPIMGGPRTAGTGKIPSSAYSSKSSTTDGGASSKSGSKPGTNKGSKNGSKPGKKNSNNRYTRDFDYEEPKENKLVAWFKDLSAVDYVIGITAILLVVASVVVFNIFATSRNKTNQIASFAEVGSNLSNVGIAGESTLLAMADNRMFPEEEEFEEFEEEEYAVTEYEETEDEDADSVTVVLNMQSVVKDLKIKFVNKKTEKLIAGVPFEVEINDANGKTINKTDDDKDGIIYISSMTPGSTTVKLVALSGYDKYKLPTDGQKVTVKESPDYKKINVADEVKSEKDVNAAIEDTAQQAQVESALTDTVEWVESTKTANGSNTRYTAVSADEIAVPTSTSKVGWINKLYYSFKELTSNVFIDTVRAEEGTEVTPTPEPTEEPTPTAEPTQEAEPTPTSAPEPTPTEAAPTPTTAPTPTQAAQCTDTTHSWVFTGTEVPADCINDGYKEYKCSKCNTIRKETIKALGHNYSNGVCTRCKTKQNTATPTPTVNSSAKLLTKNGEQLYVKSGDNYKVATAKDYLNNSSQTFYKQSSEASGYKYTGWQDIDGHTYFFDKDGNKVTGEQVIQGAKYNFGSDGALQTGSGNLGIDVSKWNGSVDWNKVKSSGVSYVIIRCGYRGSTTGALIEDPKFAANIKGATSAGLKVGVYFFSQATNEVEAIEEASMTLSLISGYKISYPIFLDVEPSGGRGDKIDSGTRTQVINAYCNTIRNSGYTPGVYANKSWLETKFSPGSINGKIWLAQYAAAPTYGGGYQMWQYSKSGKVSGISGNVDMNLSYLGY